MAIPSVAEIHVHVGHVGPALICLSADEWDNNAQWVLIMANSLLVFGAIASIISENWEGLRLEGTKNESNCDEAHRQQLGCCNGCLDAGGLA